MTRLLWLLSAMLAMPVAATAQGPGAPAGRVKIASGAASIVRGGQAIPAAVGAEVFEADVVRTGADGRLAVMFKDESRVALGPNSELALTAFSYSPEDDRFALGLRLARGVLSYISGLIGSLAPDAVRLQTPTSIIGVRGTHVLVRADRP